jgi:hypothetical protein
MHTSPTPAPAIPGRGAINNPPNRFERLHVERDPDCPPEERPHPRTEFYFDGTESLLTKNESPDIPFSWGMNVYRGCEHVLLGLICSPLSTGLLSASEDRSRRACRRKRSKGLG